jgi:hypothetical protein
LEKEKLVTAAKVWHTPPESGEGAPPLPNSKYKKKKTAMQVGLYTGENKRGMHTGELLINKDCGAR